MSWLQLEKGRAEIFGTEIVPGQVYTFTGNSITSVAVFTWHGCIVLVDGFPKGDPYVAKRAGSAMVEYINLHAALDERRQVAAATQKRGPRIVIAGQASVGKSTVARILINYAVRLRHKPLFVSLDASGGQGGGIPGAFTMAVY